MTNQLPEKLPRSKVGAQPRPAVPLIYESPRDYVARNPRTNVLGMTFAFIFGFALSFVVCLTLGINVLDIFMPFGFSERSPGHHWMAVVAGLSCWCGVVFCVIRAIRLFKNANITGAARLGLLGILLGAGLSCLLVGCIILSA